MIAQPKVTEEFSEETNGVEFEIQETKKIPIVCFNNEIEFKADKKKKTSFSNVRKSEKEHGNWFLNLKKATIT